MLLLNNMIKVKDETTSSGISLYLVESVVNSLVEGVFKSGIEGAIKFAIKRDLELNFKVDFEGKRKSTIKGKFMIINSMIKSAIKKLIKINVVTAIETEFIKVIRFAKNKILIIALIVKSYNDSVKG